MMAFYARYDGADVGFVSYRGLSEPTPGLSAAEGLLSFIGVGRHRDVDSFLEGQPEQLERRSENRRDRPTSPFMSSDPFFDEVVQRVDGHGFVSAVEFRGFLRDALDHRRSEAVLESEFDRLVADGLPPEYVGHGRSQWSRLSRLLGPTEPAIVQMFAPLFGGRTATLLRRFGR